MTTDPTNSGPTNSGPINSAKKPTLSPLVGALAVVVVFLVAALWVNGNFPVPIAVAIALALGSGTYLAMQHRR